ncbi:DGQHR domain-containing protein [Rathayibacter tritici]|uniref:DGQHR domain-containing protein n=1 Tax=Rathayibacter tritici TaxID=33888 RepID=UPI00142F385F
MQRSLEEDRTSEIRRYIHVGYPLSSMGKRQLDSGERRSLRKPGWLPTAIIANVVPPGDKRGSSHLATDDAVSVEIDGDNNARIELPKSWTPSKWRPLGAHPLEIIDGQHRLSAFDEDGSDDFEVPVVLFVGLDFSWQAYLFWTVNIKPKRINASLAYDLYPLLREQDWLEAGESLNVYRETRAQELVESLWGDARSVWYDRINMLGQTGMKAQRPVTQAAFVRSLTTTFVRPFRGNKGFGGLFGGAANNSGLNWPRGQQSAFLIFAWQALAEAVFNDRHIEWALDLRRAGEVLVEPDDPRNDPAFSGETSLLASDQGVRGFHMVLNDLAYLGQIELQLAEWRIDEDMKVSPESQLDEAMETLSSNEIGRFLTELGGLCKIRLIEMDLRVSVTNNTG